MENAFTAPIGKRFAWLTGRKLENADLFKIRGIRGQRSEVGRQISEVGGRKTENCWISKKKISIFEIP